MAVCTSSRLGLTAHEQIVGQAHQPKAVRLGQLAQLRVADQLSVLVSGRPRTPGEVRRMLRTAGFTRVRRHRTDVPLICSVLSARKPGQPVKPRPPNNA